MAEATLLTGKRGEGKSKVAVKMIRDYLRQGRVVATNLDLKLEGLLSPLSDTTAIRLPDHPTAVHLESLPLGNPCPTKESRNGLLVLDEVSTFLNSREWNDKGRKAFISWLAQSRKFGWDLVLICQHPRMVDAQIRDSLCEMLGVARNLNKISVPFLSPVWSLITGNPLRFPAFHFVSLFYGFAKNAPKAGQFFFNGSDLHAGYDTLQVISPLTGKTETEIIPSAWEKRGQFMTKTQLYRGVAISSMILGLLIGGVVGHFFFQSQEEKQIVQEQKESLEKFLVVGIASVGASTRILLSNGDNLESTEFRNTPEGQLWRSGDKWYRQAP